VKPRKRQSLGGAERGDGAAEGSVDEFWMDRKKDSRGNLRVLPSLATPENAPRLDFCETQKETMEFLAVPSIKVPPKMS
jgi:hypothetical protein